MHVDRLFDVGLYLIEKLAHHPLLRAWSVCVCMGVEWGTVGDWLAFGCRYDYVDAEQQETMLLARVLIITAIFGICLQQLTLDFVFLSFFSHAQQ